MMDFALNGLLPCICCDSGSSSLQDHLRLKSSLFDLAGHASSSVKQTSEALSHVLPSLLDLSQCQACRGIDRSIAEELGDLKAVESLANGLKLIVETLDCPQELLKCGAHLSTIAMALEALRCMCFVSTSNTQRLANASALPTLQQALMRFLAAPDAMHTSIGSNALILVVIIMVERSACQPSLLYEALQLATRVGQLKTTGGQHHAGYVDLARTAVWSICHIMSKGLLPRLEAVAAASSLQASGSRAELNELLTGDALLVVAHCMAMYGTESMDEPLLRHCLHFCTLLASPVLAPGWQSAASPFGLVLPTLMQTLCVIGQMPHTICVHAAYLECLNALLIAPSHSMHDLALPPLSMVDLVLGSMASVAISSADQPAGAMPPPLQLPSLNDAALAHAHGLSVLSVIVEMGGLVTCPPPEPATLAQLVHEAVTCICQTLGVWSQQVLEAGSRHQPLRDSRCRYGTRCHLSHQPLPGMLIKLAFASAAFLLSWAGGAAGDCVNSTDAKGFTIMHKLALAGLLDPCKVEVAGSGLDLEKRSREGLDALAMARSRDASDVVQFLTDRLQLRATRQSAPVVACSQHFTSDHLAWSLSNPHSESSNSSFVHMGGNNIMTSSALEQLAGAECMSLREHSSSQLSSLSTLESGSNLLSGGNGETQGQPSKPIPNARPSRFLQLDNVATRPNKAALEMLLGSFGALEIVRIFPGKSHAYISFMSPADGILAKVTLDGQMAPTISGAKPMAIRFLGCLPPVEPGEGAERGHGDFDEYASADGYHMSTLGSAQVTELETSLAVHHFMKQLQGPLSAATSMSNRLNPNNVQYDKELASRYKRMSKVEKEWLWEADQVMAAPSSIRGASTAAVVASLIAARTNASMGQGMNQMLGAQAVSTLSMQQLYHAGIGSSLGGSPMGSGGSIGGSSVTSRDQSAHSSSQYDNLSMNAHYAAAQENSITQVISRLPKVYSEDGAIMDGRGGTLKGPTVGSMHQKLPTHMEQSVHRFVPNKSDSTSFNRLHPSPSNSTNPSGPSSAAGSVSDYQQLLQQHPDACLLQAFTYGSDAPSNAYSPIGLSQGSSSSRNSTLYQQQQLEESMLQLNMDVNMRHTQPLRQQQQWNQQCPVGTMSQGSVGARQQQQQIQQLQQLQAQSPLQSSRSQQWQQLQQQQQRRAQVQAQQQEQIRQPGYQVQQQQGVRESPRVNLLMQQQQMGLRGVAPPQRDQAALYAAFTKASVQQQQQQQQRQQQDPPAEIPASFLCPLTGEVMREPVMAGDGVTYERDAISRWMACNSSSPVTGDQLCNQFLAPNLSLRVAIMRELGSRGGR